MQDASALPAGFAAALDAPPSAEAVRAPVEPLQRLGRATATATPAGRAEGLHDPRSHPVIRLGQLTQTTDSDTISQVGRSACEILPLATRTVAHELARTHTSLTRTHEACRPE